MPKGKGGNTVAAVRLLAEPIADSLGLRIWDICFVKEGSDWFLRIFIDKDGGVDMNDCVDFSHAIDGPLDDADPIEQSYCLEVSSPGLERELTKNEHFESCIGQNIKLRLIRPYEDKRDFKGVLSEFDGTNIVIALAGEDKTISMTKKETAWVKLDDFNK